MTGIDNEMKFEELRDSIESLLIANQTGRYQVILGQKQAFSADEFKGILRTIQIYYSSGEYDRGRSSKQKIEHDCNFTLNYYVSSPAKADISVLNPDSGSTASAKQAAMANIQTAFRLCDGLMDEFRRMITQILMDPANDQLGMQLIGDSSLKRQVSNVWLSNFRKDQPINRGNNVDLTATETLNCRIKELTPGVTATAGVQPIIDITNNEQPIDGTVLDPPALGIQTTAP